MQDFNQYKADAIQNDPKVYSTNLGNIKITPDSYDDGFIILTIEGTPIKMSVNRSFFKELTKILNITNKLQRNMSDGEDDNAQFSNLLDALKVIQNSAHPKEVALVFDQISKQITHITDKGYNRLANVEIFNFAEGLLNQYPMLELFDIIGGSASADVEIRLLNTGIADFGAGEEFQFGATLANKRTVTSLGDFAYRLVCLNGMMGIKTDERFALGGTDADNLFKLFEHFDTMKSQRFIPVDFEVSMRTAIDVPASLDELMHAVNAVSKGIVGEFPEQKDAWVQGMQSQYFPAYQVVLEKLKRKGFDIAELTKKQKEHVKTDMNMWDLVNALTNLGSNDTPFTLTNKLSLQRLGGKMLSKEFDLKDFELFFL